MLLKGCGGIKLCWGRGVVGSDRAVGEVSIVAMATCGLHRGNGVVDGART